MMQIFALLAGAGGGSSVQDKHEPLQISKPEDDRGGDAPASFYSLLANLNDKPQPVPDAPGDFQAAAIDLAGLPAGMVSADEHGPVPAAGPRQVLDARLVLISEHNDRGVDAGRLLAAADQAQAPGRPVEQPSWGLTLPSLDQLAEMRGREASAGPQPVTDPAKLSQQAMINQPAITLNAAVTEAAALPADAALVREPAPVLTGPAQILASMRAAIAGSGEPAAAQQTSAASASVTEAVDAIDLDRLVAEARPADARSDALPMRESSIAPLAAMIAPAGPDNALAVPTTPSGFEFAFAGATGSGSTVSIANYSANLLQFAPQVAQGAAQQVVSALANISGNGNRMEVMLDPPELGRVFIEYSFEGERIVSAVISAEQSETSSLMRRNIDLLVKELAHAGFDDVKLAFGDHGSRDFDQPAGHGRDTLVAAEEIETAVAPAPGLSQIVRASQGDGIDLRL